MIHKHQEIPEIAPTPSRTTIGNPLTFLHVLFDAVGYGAPCNDGEPLGVVHPLSIGVFLVFGMHN